MINCPNPSCKTANPEGADVCQVCQSALPHFYLWGVGDLVANIRPGQLLNQRYLLKRDHTFLDTKPGLIPESLPELPDFLLPYLHLSAYPLHTPRPYAVMRTPDNDYVLMLESSALSTATQPKMPTGQAPGLLPQLTKRWAEAPPLRQLNWLWQIAQVWDAFVTEKVAATLLNESLLRVDGSVIRLLALDSPPVPSPTTAPVDSTAVTAQPSLAELGRFLQPLAETAHQATRGFLQRLCDRLERQLLTTEQLAEQLSSAIAVCEQGQVVNYDMAVYTDQGPTRKRNEDACYPASDTSQTLTSELTRTSGQLLIVCDGIGGHQGGDVASKLAIATIEARLKPLLESDRPELTTTQLTLAIEAAICAANDEISAQNDQAQRQARDRMGTTLVMALIKGADIFIAHLGDSRAYRISHRNCQQVTLDDDVASRQVRLGGSLYREVLPQPGSGSLIQALGMGPSQALRPTVQRFVLDESCVFLLCSDGLSDSDRVEQFWQPVIRPLVLSAGEAAHTATLDATAAVGRQLVDLANKYNGHDNVTVGLINAQVVRVSDRIVPRELSPRELSEERASTAGEHVEADSNGVTTAPGHSKAHGQKARSQTVQTKIIAPLAGAPNSQPVATSKTGQKTGLSSSGKSRSNQLPKAGLALLVLAGLAGIGYFLFPGLSQRFTNAPEVPASNPSNPAANQPPNEDDSPQNIALAPANLEIGSYRQIRQSDIPGISASPSVNTASTDKDAENGPATRRSVAQRDQFVLYPNPVPDSEAEVNVITGTIPTGGIVKVVKKQTTPDQSAWVQLKLCSIPSGATLNDVPTETDEPSANGSATNGNTADGSAANGSAAASALNTPDSVGAEQSLILPPGSEGWAIENQIAAVSENIENLQPTQAGQCAS
ncbi:MAG: protein phosphatase 2C domain-containing protein [Cyanobacteria bacterium J06649_5]